MNNTEGIRNYIVGRRLKGWSVRRIARDMGITVGRLHQTMGCRDQSECEGIRCAIGRKDKSPRRKKESQTRPQSGKVQSISRQSDAAKKQSKTNGA